MPVVVDAIFSLLSILLCLVLVNRLYDVGYFVPPNNLVSNFTQAIVLRYKRLAFIIPLLTILK